MQKIGLFFLLLWGFSCTRPPMYLISDSGTVPDRDMITFEVVHDPPYPVGSGETRFMQEIEVQMSRKGYWRSGVNPDFLLFIKFYADRMVLPTVVVTEKEQRTLDRRRLPKGTLMVQWVHRETQQTIWRGMITGVPKKMEERQWQHLIQKIGHEFPSSKTTSWIVKTN